MKRHNGSRITIVAFLLLALLAPAAARADYFSVGDYIIPMDSVLQPYAYDTTNHANDDFGIFQSYGLIYKLLDAGVTVYWIINPNPNRTSAYNVSYPDMTLTGSSPLVDLHANSDARGSTGLSSATTIKYFGGPFVLNVQNPTIKAKVDNVIATWVADRANSRVNGSTTDVKHVSIHVSKVNFSAPVGRVMRGTPPKIALLDEGSNVNILRGYLYISGLGGSVGSIYDLKTPSEVKNGALRKTGTEYPYNILWAPHWEGTKYYSQKTWNTSNLLYPGTKNLSGKSLGNVTAVSTDNLTVTTDDSANFGSMTLGDNVVFYDKNQLEVFQKPVTGWSTNAKTINVSPALTAAEILKIGSNASQSTSVKKINSTTSLDLNNWSTDLVVGLVVKIYDKNGVLKLSTTLASVNSGSKRVTLANPLPNTNSDTAKTLGWTKWQWNGSVGLSAGTLVDDDLVVQEVAAFLEGGNTLFAECASIEVFEGSPYGRFLSTRYSSITTDPGGHANLSKNGLDPKSTMVVTQLSPSSPFAQIGDFPYYNTGGHLHNWKAINASGALNPASTYPGSGYYAGTTRFVHLADNTQTGYPDSGPTTWYNSGWDAAVGGKFRGQADKGYVFYLGGHKYVQSSFTGNVDGTYTGLYPNADADNSADEKGGVAGIRYVLNTLLNLRYEVLVKEFVRSSPVTTADSQLFLGSFEYPGYKGHFRSYNALANDVSTDNTHTFYDAAARFPSADSRSLYYKNPSTATFKGFTTTNLYNDYSGAFDGMDSLGKAALVNRYRGKEARIDESTGAYLETSPGSGILVYDESGKLGAIHYSTPAIVGYSSNVAGGATRPRVAYVVDGWGVLHAIFAPSVPRPPDTTPVIDNTWTTTSFGNTVAADTTKYKLSGTLNVSGAGDVTLSSLEPGAEIYGWVTDNHELNYLKDFGTWYTKGVSASPKTADLLMDVGGGVKRYRTLLVVPQGEGTTDVPVLDVTDPLKPTLKYVLDNSVSGYSDIGHSKSFAIGRVWVNDGTTAAIRNYLFYATESVGGTPGITMAAVDLDTKTVAWRYTMAYDNTSTPNDIPGGPSIVDANGDGIIDYVFAGDYEGRVWGLYASQTGRTYQNNPTTAIPAGRSIYASSTSAPQYPVANVGAGEPVGVVPTVYKEGTRLNVVFGTGGTDWAPSVNPSTLIPITYHVYSYDANKPVTNPTLSTGGATPQWTYDLPPGEKVYGNIVKAGPYLFLGTAYGTALNKTDPTADIPTDMAQSGHLIILQATGATTTAANVAIDREVANIQVGKMVAAVDIRHGKVFYTALTTDANPTNIVLRNITGIGSANADLIGNQGGPGNRIEVLYWKELK